MSGQNNISLFTLGLTSNDHSVGSESGKTIKVATQINAENIISLNGTGIILERRVVTSNFVNVDASGEGNTTL